MTPALLTLLLVALVGARIRLAPPPRRPGEPDHAPSRLRRSPIPHRRRATAPDPGGVAQWCDGLSRAVRGGATLGGAIRATEPPAGAHDVVASVVLRLERGAPLNAAVNSVTSGSRDHDHLRLALTVIGACAEHGGPPAEPLDRVAAALRDRAADLADRRVQSAQARASARVMTLLPVATLGVLVATSAPVRAAVSGPVGVAIVIVGGGLNLLGWRWMAHVVTPSRP